MPEPLKLLFTKSLNTSVALCSFRLSAVAWAILEEEFRLLDAIFELLLAASDCILGLEEEQETISKQLRISAECVFFIGGSFYLGYSHSQVGVN
ncbi:MAG TPA: hypothetical protein VJ464_24045 [Blastocatellia bacterium]|nr:hypothetical protein [Blastocatellia bacterium]